MPKVAKQKPVKPPKATPPITGTASQKDKARDDRLHNLEERLSRLEQIDDDKTAAALLLREQLSTKKGV